MKQISIAAAALFLAGCAGGATTTTLTPADAATSLIVGDQLALSLSSANSGSEDPLVTLTLTHADGRRMAFEEANHAPHDLVVQAPDGALAQVMALPSGEIPTLYRRNDDETPFLCAPDGPVAVGMHRAADGGVLVVGLKQNFAVETRADGSYEALPYSPDFVCARLRLRR